MAEFAGGLGAADVPTAYVSGRSIALVRRDGLLLVHPSLPYETAVRVWSELDSAEHLSEVLSILGGDARASDTGFAYLAVSATQLRSISFGGYVVTVFHDVGEEVLPSGQWSVTERVPGRRWGLIERDVAAVAAKGVHLPIAEGAVLASRVVWDPVVAAATAHLDSGPGLPEAAVAEPFSEVSGADSLSVNRSDAQLFAAPVLAGPVLAEPEPTDEDWADAPTLLSSELVELRKQLPTWPSDQVPGPFAVPQPAQRSAGTARDDAESGGASSSQRRSAPSAIPGADRAGSDRPKPAGRPRSAKTERIPPPLTLRLSNGRLVPVVRPVLLGRAPKASRSGGDQVPVLVSVPSPNKDISRTHAKVELIGGTLHITDLNSTNGVDLVRPDGETVHLAPGKPTRFEHGDVVDLGDGFSFELADS